ncbi:type IV pilus assembly protein PilM [Gaiella sp.]|uniref:type IV pilus assembly protein PilM n=1 Tax=Gaiella sp. TaxID=2663207 RepID=UPI0032643182
MPSASFDPSSTGDPLLPGGDQPSIGFGTTRADGHLGTSDPQRRPIGFAPPEQDRSEPSYRTELSFKRHASPPRASATPEQPGAEDSESWHTTEATRTDEPALDAVADRTKADADPEDASVPFYKREIGFGRKKKAATSEPVGDESTVNDSFEGASDEAEFMPPASAVVDAAPVEELQEPLADETESRTEVEAATEPTVEDAIVDEAPQAKVPFYRREISLRRKPEVTENETEVAAAAFVASSAASVESDAGESTDTGDEGANQADVDEPDPLDVASAEHDTAAMEPAVESVVEPEDAVEPVVDSVEAVGASVEPFIDSLEADDVVEAATDDAWLAQADGSDAVSEPGDATFDFDIVSEPGDPLFDFDILSDSNTLSDADTPSTSDTIAEAVPPMIGEADDVVVPENDATTPVAEVDDDVPSADAVSDDKPAAGTPVAPASRFSRRKPNRTSKDKGRPSRSKKGRTVVGLKIGASQIAAAVVNKSDEGHELVGLARRPLASGIVVDGEVRDHDALAMALKSFFDEEKLPRKDVRIGVSSNRIGVRTFDLLGTVDEKQFDNAVRFKAHELLPVAVHESVLDYRVLGERPNAEGETMRRVLLVVAPRDQVEPYARVADAAGLKLAGIDLEALALLRAFVEPKPAAAGVVADTATVVVAIGHDSSTLLVAGGGACEFTRVFDWGGGELEQAIASTLDVDLDEAAVILKHLSLSGPGLRLETLDDDTRERAVDAIRHRLTTFARELVNSLQFYQTQAESLGIGGIVVTGGTSHLEGLEAALQQMIGVDVEIGDPLTRVSPTGDFDPVIEAMIGSMAVPIGLAIDDATMRGVNLIPGDAAKQKSTRKTALTIAGPVAIAVPLVALGFLYVGARGSASDSQSQIDAVAAEIASLPKPAAPRIAANIVGDEAVRATAVASVLGGRVAWDAVFRDLSLVLPANVWLQSLSLAQPESIDPASAAAVAAPLPGQAPAAPSAVKIDGFTYDQPDVARLLARLAVLPTLERVTLVSSEQSKVGDKAVVHFVIVADLKNAGGAS